MVKQFSTPVRRPPLCGRAQTHQVIVVLFWLPARDLREMCTSLRCLPWGWAGVVKRACAGKRGHGMHRWRARKKLHTTCEMRYF